jgi:hypothetical protein
LPANDCVNGISFTRDQKPSLSSLTRGFLFVASQNFADRLEGKLGLIETASVIGSRPVNALMRASFNRTSLDSDAVTNRLPGNFAISGEAARRFARVVRAH